MSAQKQLEAAIQKATNLKRDLEGLVVAFDRLIPLIDKEHVLIKGAKLNELEFITDEKERLGQIVVDLSDAILRTSEDLRRQYLEVIPEAQSEKGAGMKECLGWLKEIRLSLGQDGLATQVLAHLEQKLESIYVDLVHKKQSSQGKIAINTLLTRELLHRHRENIRLIQEMVAEANSTYSPSGSTRSQEPRSVLSVKA